MKENALALILLTVFGFGLLTGPHPCSGRHEEEKGRHSSPCHGTEAEHGTSVRASDPAHERSDCCGTFCQHACHMTAVAETATASSIIAPVAQAVAEAFDPGLPLFAHAIDHVPLA